MPGWALHFSDLEDFRVKLVSFLLLLAGWLLVLASIVLLPSPAARAAFVFSGLAVELLGLALVFRSHSIVREKRG